MYGTQENDTHFEPLRFRIPNHRMGKTQKNNIEIHVQK